MATDVPSQAQARAALRGWKPYRLTVRQYLKMIEGGVFPDHVRVELLGGLLAERMTRHPPHDYAVSRLGKLLGGMLLAPMFAREEKAIVLGRYWRPEPDVAVYRGPEELFDNRTPRAKDVALLVEVSDSSYVIDRGRKWRLYAAARIDPYWIVNLPARRIEVYANPAGRGERAYYRETTIFEEDAEVPVILGGAAQGHVAVAAILPRR